MTRALADEDDLASVAAERLTPIDLVALVRHPGHTSTVRRHAVQVRSTTGLLGEHHRAAVARKRGCDERRVALRRYERARPPRLGIDDEDSRIDTKRADHERRSIGAPRRTARE